MTQYRLFLAGFIAFAVAIGTASAEPVNIGKLHALLWNQEAEAMARYGADGDEIPEVRVANPTVTTERAEDGTILAVVKAQFFTGGRVRRIAPDVYYTDVYCVMEEDLEAARRIRADQQLILIGPIASVETYDEKTRNSWFSTKRAIMYPCSILNPLTAVELGLEFDCDAWADWASQAYMRLGESGREGAAAACREKLAGLPAGVGGNSTDSRESCAWFLRDVLGWENATDDSAYMRRCVID
ncbi:hypothetical protein WI697_18855 [Tistrella mobilis]|uniref:hypothetical protein n=1 Tax=Tistrella mobilis TaxID=171437 RepID=UPI0031F6C044